MDILDNIDEYHKLKDLVDKHYKSNSDTKVHLENKLGQALETIETSKQQLHENVHSKLGQTVSQLDTRLNDHNKVVASFKDQIGQDHEKIIKTVHSLGQTQQQLEQTVSALGQTRQQVDQVLFQMKQDIENEKVCQEEYQKSVEEYKKITNERIEKLVKLFLSINK